MSDPVIDRRDRLDGMPGHILRSPALAGLVVIVLGILLTTFFYKVFTHYEEALNIAAQSRPDEPASSRPATPKAASVNAPLSEQASFDPTGIWSGQVTLGNQSVDVTFRFWLEDNRLLGVARFPIGDGKITGTLNAGRLEFKTEHNQPGTQVQASFSGSAVNVNEVELEMNSEGGRTSITLGRHAEKSLPW
jgi:hypothetical protein